MLALIAALLALLVLGLGYRRFLGIPLVALPWTYTITTTIPAVIANVVAQGNSDNIGCRITVLP